MLPFLTCATIRSYTSTYKTSRLVCSYHLIRSHNFKRKSSTTWDSRLLRYSKLETNISMENISNVFITDCKESQFLKPLRIHYTQNGKQKIWDVMKVHNSVAVIIYNVSRDVLVFVKQFRPAVYYCSVQKEANRDDGRETIDTSKFPASHGITYELCAGIIDKDMSFQKTAQAEVLEECGYKVPLEKFQRITSFRTGVGTTGALQELYYVEVTDFQRIAKGGGIVEEEEFIDIIEVPVDQGKNLLMDETIQKPAAFLFALVWFYENIRKTYR